MEEFKEKIPTILIAIIAVVIAIVAIYLVFIQKNVYYVKIDNTKIEEISNTDDMKFEYKLTAYNKNGKSKEISFKTTRELREGAYLELETMAMRGVINWKEVQENELPDKVKAEMNIN